MRTITHVWYGGIYYDGHGVASGDTRIQLDNGVVHHIPIEGPLSLDDRDMLEAAELWYMNEVQNDWTYGPDVEGGGY